MNHHMGRAAGLVEPLDERVALYLKEIIRNGSRCVKELQSKASEFVRVKIFHGERPPDLSGEGLILFGRKYTISSLGSNLKRVILKLIKKMLQNKREKWARWNQVFFSPRFACSLCQEICAWNDWGNRYKKYIMFFYFLRCLSSNVLYYFQS